MLFVEAISGATSSQNDKGLEETYPQIIQKGCDGKEKFEEWWVHLRVLWLEFMDWFSFYKTNLIGPT